MDLTRRQSQQSAEFLRPFRPLVPLHAPQRRRVVRHDGHVHGHERSTMALVSDGRGPSAEEARHETFDHWPPVDTGVGNGNLGRGGACWASPPG